MYNLQVRTFLIILLSIAMCSGAIAQRQVKGDAPPPPTNKKGIIYKKEWTIGAKISSNGWGVNGDFGKILNIRKTRMFYFEFGDIIHPKEKKQSAELNLLSTGISNPRDFYFGKQNDFFLLRAAFGYKQTIAEKANKSGVRLSVVYMGGISLGFLKPYYLELAYFVQNPADSTFQLISRSEKYNDDPENGNADKFMNWYEILGASPYGKGFNEIEPVPGGYLKVGLDFEWGTRDGFITSLEAGVTMDAYYKRVPIMINARNNFVFFGAYLGLHIGRRS